MATCSPIPPKKAKPSGISTRFVSIRPSTAFAPPGDRLTARRGRRRRDAVCEFGICAAWQYSGQRPFGVLNRWQVGKPSNWPLDFPIGPGGVGWSDLGNRLDAAFAHHHRPGQTFPTSTRRDARSPRLGARREGLENIGAAAKAAIDAADGPTWIITGARESAP